MWCREEVMIEPWVVMMVAVIGVVVACVVFLVVDPFGASKERARLRERRYEDQQYYGHRASFLGSTSVMPDPGQPPQGISKDSERAGPGRA
jgi:hypothetical protein